MNPARDRGIRAEREACAILTQALDLDVRRMATEGRFDDIGDISGVPDTTIQVSAVPDKPAVISLRAIAKSVDVTRQSVAAGTTHAVVLLRIDGGHWRAVCTGTQLRQLSTHAWAHAAVFRNPPKPGLVIRWAPLFSCRDWSLIPDVDLLVADLDGWARTWLNQRIAQPTGVTQ